MLMTICENINLTNSIIGLEQIKYEPAVEPGKKIILEFRQSNFFLSYSRLTLSPQEVIIFFD